MRLLDVTPDELRQLLARPAVMADTAAPPVPVEPPERDRLTLDRRTVLLGAAALSTIDQVRRAVNLLMEASSVSPFTLEHWERRPYVHAAVANTAPPASTLADVMADFAELRYLLGQPQTTKARMTLCRVSGQLALLAGILLSWLGHRRDGQAWFHTAQLAAREAGDTVLAGTVVARSALVSWQFGATRSALVEGQEARELLTTGAAGAQPGLYRALTVEARALARSGQMDKARRRLDDAEDAFAQFSPDDMVDAKFGVPRADKVFTIGRVYAALGQPDEAERHFTKALTLYPADEWSDPTLIQLDRARLMVADGAAADGCRHAATTLAALPQELRSGLTYEYQTFLKELPASVRTAPAARELGELLTDRATAP